jgi:hypothetical protein
MLLPPERLRDALAPLAPLLAEPDIAVANYETATGSGNPFFGVRTMSLSAPPEWMGEAHRLFGALTVANNHACDLGKPGFEATLAAARELGVTVVGGDARDPWKPRVLVEKGGKRVCAIAWTTFTNSEGRACKGSGELAVAGFDRKGRMSIERAVSRASHEGCDGVVAIFHGGREYETQIWGARLQARAAAEAGADAVVIHHPHIPSPLEVLTTRDGRKVPVFESVGNLVSNQGESYKLPLFPVSPKHAISLNAWTRLGVLADLEWSWSGGDKGDPAAPEHAHLAWGYHLLWTDNEHADNRNEKMPRIAVRPVDPRADRPLIDRLSCDHRGPLRLFSDPCWLEATGQRCQAPPPAEPAVGM